MPNPTPTIELPRLPDESARAYAARVEYVTMGAGRSLEKLRVQSGGKAGIPRRFNTLAEWSARYDWAGSARQYDEQIAYITIQEAQAKYRTDLEAHRKKASDAGQALYAVAGQLITAINKALAGPRKIRDKDGKEYTLHSIDLNANTFSIAARAMQAALDLEAHALAVDVLLPKLGQADDSE